MATKADITAAMAAIEKALRPEPSGLWKRITASARTLFVRAVPSPLAAEVQAEVTTLARFVLGDKADGFSAARSALEDLAMRLGLTVVDDDAWGDDETPLEVDSFHIDEALRRSRCGQIDDTLHHLERALPEGYGVIAERLASHMRTRP